MSAVTFLRRMFAKKEGSVTLNFTVSVIQSNYIMNCLVVDIVITCNKM